MEENIRSFLISPFGIVICAICAYFLMGFIKAFNEYFAICDGEIDVEWVGQKINDAEDLPIIFFLPALLKFFSFGPLSG